MIKRSLMILCLLFLGCSHSANYLDKIPPPPPVVPPPPPPPPPPRYEKTYKFETSSTESAAVDIDIIWVIDNSTSMGEEQQAVIDGSAEFMRQFTSSTHLHWRMGLLSSHPDDPPYMGFDTIVDWQSPDAISTFNTAVGRLGLRNESDPDEQAFLPILKATQEHPTFLRKNAFLVMISVSDEHERGYDSVDSFLQQLDQRVGAGGHYMFFGVYPPYDRNSDGDSDTAAPGSRYYEVVKRTHGKIYDLYSSDFGGEMAKLGKDLVSSAVTVNPKIMLDQRPKPETIRVVYQGQTLRPGLASAGGQWNYDPVFNTIEVHDPALISVNHLDVQVSFVVEASGN